MARKSKERISLYGMVSAMLIFGTVGLLRRFIPLSSALLAFSRGMLGGLFLLVFLKLRRKKAVSRPPLSTALRLILTGAAMGINWLLLFEAYNYTTVAVATLCYYMQPTIVILLSPLLFKEKLTSKKAVCAAAAILGMVLVSGVIGGEKGQGNNLKGIAFGLSAAVFYAFVVIMNKRTPGVDAYSKTTVQLFSAGAVMLPYLLMTGGFQFEALRPLTMVLLLVAGILHTGIAYVLYFGSMDGLKAQSVAILSYIDPVAALLFSAIFLREPLSAAGVVGAILIIGSAVLSEAEKGRR